MKKFFDSYVLRQMLFVSGIGLFFFSFLSVRLSSRWIRLSGFDLIFGSAATQGLQSVKLEDFRNWAAFFLASALFGILVNAVHLKYKRAVSALVSLIAGIAMLIFRLTLIGNSDVKFDISFWFLLAVFVLLFIVTLSIGDSNRKKAATGKSTTININIITNSYTENKSTDAKNK